MSIEPGSKAEKKLADDVISGVTEVGKRSEEVLSMSQQLSNTLLGHSSPPTPRADSEKPNEPQGFLKETVGLLGRYNDRLSTAMDNLTAILKQF